MKAFHNDPKIVPHAIELVGLKDEADKMRAAKTLNEAKYALAIKPDNETGKEGV